jgi:uridine phosphorylase
MSRIDESELILTKENKVYHLQLSSEDIAPLVITVGDPERVHEVSKYFDVIEVRAKHREFVTHTGRIGKKRITVLSSGIGPDNIDIVMNELDACVNIDFDTRTIKEQHTSLHIIRFGTSGSLQADIPVDSFVASTHGIGLDNVLHYYPTSTNEIEKNILASFLEQTSIQHSSIMPYVAEGSAELLTYFKEGYHQGITVTCPGFYAPQGRVVRAGLQFPTLVDELTHFRLGDLRITNFEMETSAIFGLGKVFGHSCLAINTIVANRVHKTFSKNSVKSIDEMIKKNLEMISTIP